MNQFNNLEPQIVIYTKKMHLDRESFPRSLNLPGWTSPLVFQQGNSEE